MCDDLRIVILKLLPQPLCEMQDTEGKGKEKKKKLKKEKKTKKKEKKKESKKDKGAACQEKPRKMQVLFVSYRTLVFHVRRHREGAKEEDILGELFLLREEGLIELDIVTAPHVLVGKKIH